MAYLVQFKRLLMSCLRDYGLGPSWPRHLCVKIIQAYLMHNIGSATTLRQLPHTGTCFFTPPALRTNNKIVTPDTNTWVIHINCFLFCYRYYDCQNAIVYKGWKLVLTIRDPKPKIPRGAQRQQGKVSSREWHCIVLSQYGVGGYAQLFFQKTKKKSQFVCIFAWYSKSKAQLGTIF